MNSKFKTNLVPRPDNWLAESGKMGKQIREVNWSGTPLGPIESWSRSLHAMVGLCLASRFPISIVWGPHRNQIYNENYRSICGKKHPRSMGQDFKECWQTAWPAIGEAFERARAGETSFVEECRVFLDRHGYLEEAFFTFSFGPIRDERGEIGGVFHPVIEMTEQTLAERRLRVLRDLADRTSNARTVEEACFLIFETLAESGFDLPFLLFYRLDADGKRARLAGSTGLASGTAASPEIIDLEKSSSNRIGWPLALAIASGHSEQVDELEARFGPLSCGPYTESPRTALVLPINMPKMKHPFALLVAGVSARRALDDRYRRFYDLLAGTVTEALGNARACEEGQRRADALAGIPPISKKSHTNMSYDFTGVEAMRVEGPGSTEIEPPASHKYSEADQEPSDNRYSARALLESARSREALGERERGLGFLSEITRVLVTSLDSPMMLKEIAEGVLPMLGDFCFFDMLAEAGQIHRLASAYHDPERRQWFSDLMKITRLLDSTEPPISHVIASGEPVFEPNITNEWKQQIATSPEHLEVMRSAGLHSLISVPVAMGAKMLGVMTCCFVSPNRCHTKEDLWLAEEVGRRTAFALHHARLYQQSLEREEQLRQSEQALKETSRIKDEFLATLSHELRSPLNATLGYVHLLRSSKPDEQMLAHYLDVIERNARMQAQLLEDLLDNSRIITGKFQLESRPLNFAEVVENALDVIRPAAESKGVKLSKTLDYNAGKIVGDRDRLQQAVWNLVANAIKFTPEGGRIDVKLSVEHSQLFLVVHDTGEGIPLDFLPHVFDRFRQADASSSRRHSGLGLGLALVRHIVELHGGTVIVQSGGPGQGATFTIGFPILAIPNEQESDQFLTSKAQTENTKVLSHPPSLAGVRVLAVDDQAEARELVSTILTGYGVEVTTASSGSEALRLLSDQALGRPPDVLLCDIGMPDQNGYQVVRKLRELESERGVPLAKRIPAVALTAYAQVSDRVLTLAAGFQMHVPKPIDEQELIVVIASLTGRLKKEMEK